ncbi:MAG: DNA mismatch repair endonuclease MutL [Patescibacteria group bacterium]
MPKIKILPDTLISQIAAGEVVERPASALKELIENSLDAGAKFIGIEAEQGGMKLIAVRDDGTGMDGDDAVMAFARHATSKISELDDLANISTFGFRGEALAAIASVAQVSLKTRKRENEEGSKIIYKGGVMESKCATGCPPGTEVVIRNLFFNTPARKKFLKAENTELSHLAAVVSHMAMANPAVGFEFKHNGKTLIQVPALQTPQARLAAILGKNFLGEALPISFKTESIHIHGFIGRPGASLASKRHQYLFVNGRDVSDPMVSRAVTDAYGSRLPARTWPVFILHIDIDPVEVDVNVHPRKLAVKFVDTQRIFRDVMQAVSQSLLDFEQGMFQNAHLQNSAALPNASSEISLQNALNFSEKILTTQDRSQKLSLPTQLKILGQIANSYILVLDEEGLAIVDQHAAHERILYESFKRQSIEREAKIQPLLVPLNIECSPQEATFLRKAIGELSSFGFEFDEWSGNTFVIRSCPLALKSENLEKILRDFLDEVMGDAGISSKNILPERILKSLACKGAVKFGMPLTLTEQEELLRQLQKTPNLATCPHGRPTRVLVTFDELEKRFYRK